MYNSFGGFGMSGWFDKGFGLVFFLFIAVLAVMLFRGIAAWHKNNQSPRLTVNAVLVSKRQDVSGGHGNTSAHTWYYATFQVESGDRMELSLSGKEYGMLAEGDCGRLCFQGTRFLGFDREAA